MSETITHQSNIDTLGYNLLRSAVDAADIPSAVRTILQESVEAAGFADLELAGLNRLAELAYPNGDTVLYGTFTPVSDAFLTEESTLLIDVTVAGEVSGAANIQFFKEFKGIPRIVGVPFVGFTRTVEGFRRRGFAERRLYAMNAIAVSRYREPLRSGTHQVQEVIPLWDKLVSEQVAIRLPADSEFAYRFR